MEVNLTRDLAAMNSTPAVLPAGSDALSIGADTASAAFSNKLATAMAEAAPVGTKPPTGKQSTTAPTKTNASSKDESASRTAKTQTTDKPDSQTAADSKAAVAPQDDAVSQKADDSQTAATNPLLGLIWLPTAVVTPETSPATNETAPATGSDQTTVITGLIQTSMGQTDNKATMLSQQTQLSANLAGEITQTPVNDNIAASLKQNVAPVQQAAGQPGEVQANTAPTAEADANVAAIMAKTVVPAPDKMTDNASSDISVEASAVTATVTATEQTAAAVTTAATPTEASEKAVTEPTDNELFVDQKALSDTAAVTTANAAITTRQTTKSETETQTQSQDALAPATEDIAAVQAAPAGKKQSQQENLDDAGQKPASRFEEQLATASVVSTGSADKPATFTDQMAAATPPTPAHATTDRYEVARQVMDSFQTSLDRLQTSQVIVTLKPEHLGEVTIKINVDGDKVTAAFHAASSEVRSILESSLPQFKQEMSQQGWKFDSDGVYAAMSQFMGKGEEQSFQQFQQPAIATPIRPNPEDYEDMVGFSDTGKIQILSSSAVDYRV